MAAPPVSHEPLWDVVEEHLDEAAFCLQSFDARLDHPLATLDDVERTFEVRALAHLDALVVHGPKLADDLLVPALAEAGEDAPFRATAAALALLLGPAPERVEVGLVHALPAIQAATLRAIALAPSVGLEDWALARWEHASQPSERAALLPVVGARLTRPDLLAALQDDDEHVRAAAAAVVARGAQDCYGPVMTHLADDVPSVRGQALVAALCWGLPHALSLCERLAREGDVWCAELYAALRGPAAVPLLVGLLDDPSQRTRALAALGFSGDPAVQPRLLEACRSADPLEAKLAFRALSLIAGVPLDDGSLHAAPAQPDAEPPAFEDDDLTADLAPTYAALPLPDADAVARHAACAGPSAGERVLFGRPFCEDALVDALASAPLGVRHTLALLLCVRSAGRHALDTRALLHGQRRALARLRAEPLRFTRSYARAATQ